MITMNLFLLFMIGRCCLMNCQLYEYHYIQESKTWIEAQRYCREKHSDLATVCNMNDMKRLLSNTSVSDAWIGLYDQTNGKRKWHWSLPGVEFDENNWAYGEATEGGSENCGFIGTPLTWGDHFCDRQRYFLCYDENQPSQKLHVIKESKKWLEAQAYCREKHTDLASGMNMLQEEQLNNLFTPTRYQTFFGAFRDTWMWSDGSSSSFRHWTLTFNMDQYNTGNCAMLVFNDTGRWKKEDCAVRKPFICYDDKVILIKENKTWEDALSYCREHYHDLVTINSLDEQRWVQEKAKKASTDYVWVGLQFHCLYKVWTWLCPESVSYMNKASDGQMDDCHIYGAMEAEGKHRWFQKDGTEKFNFLCSVN